MSLLKSTVSSETLAKKAGNILNVFNKTISDLTSVIEEATNQSKVKQEEAKAALAESEALDEVAKSNQAIVDKIKGLLS